MIGLRLPFQFDANRLARDLALVPPEDWAPHYNEADYGGNWSGASLRSPSGRTLDLRAGNERELGFQETPLLGRCDYVREVLDAFQCPLKAVRFLSLAPGSFIREHSDNALNFEDGEVRIHVPIQTNPDVEFYVCGERLALEAGNCYYVNVNLPHRVNNRGAEARVHLVIDAVVNPWLRELFEEYSARPEGTIARSPLPPRGFREFAARVFSDAALRERLCAIGDRAELLAAAASEASAEGFTLNEADLAAAFHAEPATFSFDTRGWAPARTFKRNSEPWATWIHTAGRPFVEPFYGDSVRERLRNPFTSLFRRDMPLVAAAPVRPDGFIFHMSRCGSTLVSRSLAASGAIHVVSEPPPLDEILSTTSGISPLRDVVSALAQPRAASQQYYLIKTDAWHVLDLPRFRAAFPDVPWIFVHRDPVEVLASHMLRPGIHASPGAMDPARLGLNFADITGLTRQEWTNRVLNGFLRAAEPYRNDPQALFIDYRDLPGAITGTIAHHFRLDLTAEDLARVDSATRLDAKNPTALFSGDSAAKQSHIDALRT